MAKSFNNIFPAPETVYNRPLSFPVGVQPINSAPFVRPGGFVAPLEMEKFPIVDNPPGWPPRARPIAGPRRPPVPVVDPGRPVRVRPVIIIRPRPEVPLDPLDRPYTCVHPSSFDSANNCLKGGGTYKSNKPCGPVADSVAAERCPDPVDDGNLLLDARDSKGVLCSGPNFSGAITNCADGSRPAVDCNNNPLPCGEKHNQAAVNCADTICTAVMVSCPNGGQAANLPYYNSVTNQCGCRGNCNPFTDPDPISDPVVGCNGGAICAQDARECPDGGWVSRNPCNNCQFDTCGGGFNEQPLVRVFVPPNPNTNKDTLFARSENNMRFPLAKLNMTREEMGDVLVSNMSPTRYAQEIMNQRNIPSYVGPSINMPPAPYTTFDVAMADGRNQRMTFPNGPICGPGGKQTVFSNSLVLNDWLSNPLLRICTFSNDNFVFGGGGKKPKVVFNPKGDCNLPVVNNGILAGALPVLSLVAASNFADVGVGEAPASIPSRSVKNVSEPLPILKNRAVSTFLVAKSNSVARNGNAAGLEDRIFALIQALIIIFETRTELREEKAAELATADFKQTVMDAMFYLGTQECWSYSRTVLGEEADIQIECIRPGTAGASCVVYSVPNPSGGPSQGANYPGVGTFYVTVKESECVKFLNGHTLADVVGIGEEISAHRQAAIDREIAIGLLDADEFEAEELLNKLQKELRAMQDLDT